MTDSTDIKWNFSSYTDKKGRTYIISYYNKWDSVKKQSRVAKRIHVGRLNTDNGKVSLGKNYLEQHPEYIDCSVFYEDNRLVVRSDEEALSIQRDADIDLSWRCDCISFGLTYSLWEMAKRYGIISSLKAAFGEDGIELLRLGIYELCSHAMAMHNYEDWLSMYYLPDAQPLSSQKISRLLATVTQEKIDNYFKLRLSRLTELHQQRKEYAHKKGQYVPPLMMAMDSTSISTYSKSIDDAAFGHAKQDDFLKQVNLTLCVDYESGDVCYAYESEGSVNDMTIFPDIIMRMRNIGMDLSDILVVTDRGYSSVMNVQKQINVQIKFLTGVKLTEDAVKAKIDRYKESLSNPVFMNGALGVYARTGEVEKWSSTCDGYTIDHDVYLHLYHSGTLGEQENVNFMRDVQRLLDIQNNKLKIDRNLWQRYSKYLEQDKKTKTWYLKADAVEKACRYNGYFALRTNEISNPFDALVIYRERNIVEVAFKQFKVLNGGERLYATGSTYKGKIFIHLLAQTLRMMMCVSAAGHKADGKVLPGESLEKAMIQLKKLQATKAPGRGTYITKEIPKKTRDLFDLFGIPYPKKHIKN